MILLVYVSGNFAKSVIRLLVAKDVFPAKAVLSHDGFGICSGADFCCFDVAARVAYVSASSSRICSAEAVAATSLANL